MLKHSNLQPELPSRVVLLGASGFLARALAKHLGQSGGSVRALSRDETDLTAADADRKLAAELHDGDAIVFLSAITPDKGRGNLPFMANVKMGEAVCTAVKEKPPSHIVYIGSDAVYPFGDNATREASCAEPADLYGAAHLARELMLSNAAACPLAILRPTMIYGVGDTHNSYGANRFRRTARAEGRITLFGGGEETRDHMLIDDVVGLIDLTLRHRSAGKLNLVSGRSVSFAELAKMVAQHFSEPVDIVHEARRVPITHRRFDVTDLREAFPDFKLTPLEVGLKLTHEADLN